MHVVGLEVTDFRNYERVGLELGPGVSVFLGPNGQGKTNLVEAIAYPAALRSHRVATDAPLIRHGADSAVISLRIRRGERQAKLDLQLLPGRSNRARLNGSPLPRVRECLGLVRAVVFAPEDLALVNGDPAQRRALLDDLLVQRQPRMAGLLADLDKVLRQRGALLKNVATRRGGRPDETDRSSLDVWDEALARLGGQLWWARLVLLGELAPPFVESYRAIAGQHAQVGLMYRSSSEPGDSVDQPSNEEDAVKRLAAALPQRHSDEFRRGVSLSGPQRDDMDIALNGLPAKGFASHGETWSLALALRLASYRLLAAEALDDGGPVLILDDVFAELDAGRRDRLAEAIADAEQVLITAAVAEDVPPALSGATFRVAAGTVQAEGEAA